MKVPDRLFASLTRLDFIKCDIEGYEHVAFSNMKQVINRFTPLIQSELGGEDNRNMVIKLLESLGYTTCILKNQRLTPADDNVKRVYQSDFYFVHEKHTIFLQ
jgi:hypothetical protein